MDDLAIEASVSMDETIETLKTSLATLRTGRASPKILDQVMVDYYGDKIALNQICSVSVPEPRQLVVKPYDKNDVKAVVAGINMANLGLVPQNEGNLIRIMIPALTEERRREITKTAKKFCEEAKVNIRNIRRDFVNINKADEESSEDAIKRVEEDIQKVTDEATKKIDVIMAEKEKEIMSL